MRVAVALPVDELWRRVGLIGVAQANWQGMRRARATVRRMSELNILIELVVGTGECNRSWILISRDKRRLQWLKDMVWDCRETALMECGEWTTVINGKTYI